MTRHLEIKNWNDYQHYKANKPAWVKWYRDITNDLGWLAMEDAGKLLFPYMLLVAAENENQIPDDAALISVRLRLKIKIVQEGMASLMDSGFLHIVHEDADISECSIDSECLRREEKRQRRDREEKRRGKKTVIGFDEFWRHYPKRVGKLDAAKAWKQTAKKRPSLVQLISKVDELSVSEGWLKDSGQYVPKPATWLRCGGWDDEVRRKR